MPVRRWRRRPVDALANRMRHSTMVSGSPVFGARTIRSTVSHLGNHEKAPVGGGGSDAAVVGPETGPNARRWDSSDLLSLRELRREEEEATTTTPRFRAEDIKELVMERNIPVCGPDDKAKVKETLIREPLRVCERQPGMGDRAE